MKFKIFLMILLSFILILFFVVGVSAQPADDEEDEEPFQARPNPLRYISRQMTGLGFKVIRVKKAARGRYVVYVSGWKAKRAKGRMKGALNWDPSDKRGKTKMDGKGTDKRKLKGRGKIMVAFGKKGVLLINKTGLKKMGFKANALKFKGKMKLAKLKKIRSKVKMR